ncbi:MAG: hypothetical protein HY678_07970 [Chloroflexi bacterium]|nr:hypothetical protein [Chloroflexota bacterium]
MFRDQRIGWRPRLELGQRQHVEFILPHPFGIYGGPFKREHGRTTTRYEVPVQARYGRDVKVDVELRVATEVWSFVSYSQEKWWSRTDEVVASDIPQDTWVEIEVMGRERVWLSILD